MRSALLETQRAVAGRLRAHLGVPVYDYVPEGSTLPYVTVGEATIIEDRSRPRTLVQVTHTIHIWSASEGFDEALRIEEEIERALRGSSLAIDGWDVLSGATFEFGQTLRDPDGVTRHTVMRYRWHLLEV